MDDVIGNASEDDRILSIEIGGKTIGANLEAAIAAGRIVRLADGKYKLREKAGARPEVFIKKPGEFRPKGDERTCGFLNGFMFQNVYGKKAVPSGCRDCYKLKVFSGSLRQLMAVKETSEAIPAFAKSGSGLDSPGNRGLYSTYVYALGLDKVRALYKSLRAKIDAHSKLGPSITMIIKRGCTNYERHCGPSDQYTFDPRLAEIEDYFLKRFVQKPLSSPSKIKFEDAAKFLRMLQIAYRIGDDSYKDFTQGKDLHPPVVTYDPEASS